MSTFAAQNHGGDAGGDPPRGPYHVPSSCQSSKPKRTRGPGRSLNLFEEYQNNNNRPLPVIYDKGTMKCVGDTSNMFIRFISNQIAEHIPPYHLSWAKVPQELKDLVYPEIHHYFDIDSYRNTPLWELVKVSINKDCAERYKDRKNTLKEHFELHGGYDDLEQARAHPPTGIEESVWIETIEKLFLDTSYRHRSKVNSENRAKQPYGSYQGTSSMAARRYKKAQESTEEPSLIDAWKDTHHKEGSGWINERAADDYRKLDEARRRKRASSSTGFVDEAQILKEVLGEQRGHMKGIGRKIKRV